MVTLALPAQRLARMETGPCIERGPLRILRAMPDYSKLTLTDGSPGSPA